MIAWGEKDFVFDAHFLDQWLAYLPDAEVHRYPTGGHYILEDGGQALIDAIVQFIGSGIREDSTYGHTRGNQPAQG